jgi:hypothetical protein
MPRFSRFRLFLERDGTVYQTVPKSLFCERNGTVRNGLPNRYVHLPRPQPARIGSKKSLWPKSARSVVRQPTFPYVRKRSPIPGPSIRIFDCPQRLATLLVVETSCVRHIEAACRALKQTDPDLTLKRGNAAANRGLGHAQQARGGGEATGLDDASEHHNIGRPTAYAVCLPVAQFFGHSV